MKAAKIDGIKLKEAIDKFGSLEKAVDNLKCQKDTLSKEVIQLKQEKERLSGIKEKLLADISNLKNQYEEQKTSLQVLADNFGKWERQ